MSLFSPRTHTPYISLFLFILMHLLSLVTFPSLPSDRFLIGQYTVVRFFHVTEYLYFLLLIRSVSFGTLEESVASSAAKVYYDDLYGCPSRNHSRRYFMVLTALYFSYIRSPSVVLGKQRKVKPPRYSGFTLHFDKIR